MQKCIRGGVCKINVNKLVLDEYNDYIKVNAATTPITRLMEESVQKVKQLAEVWMSRCGSAGKA